MTLALCIITSQEDKQRAEALGASLSKYVDEVVITGPEEFKWVDDFAAARNFNFSQTKADWILWLDADDTLQNPEALKELIQYAEDNKLSGYWVKYKYAFDKNGNCVDEHWKAQLLKNDGHFTWKGPIHEDPIQLSPVNWHMTDKIVRIHKSDEDRASQSYERNLRILQKWHKDEPTEPRAMFYLGRTYMAEGSYNEAIAILQEYLKYSGWDDERYEALLIIGRAFDALGQTDNALLAYNDAILEKEINPDAYIYKAYCYITQEKYNTALVNLKIALQLPVPNAVTYFNPLFYSRDVYHAIAVAYLHLAELQDCITALKYALKADPKYEPCLELYSVATRLKEKHDAAKNVIELVKYAEKSQKSKIPQILNAVPGTLYDDPLIGAMRKKFLPPKKWPTKSIAVFCGTSAEDWSPGTVNTGGIGGSETAVVELSKRLVKLGWQVTVFNQGSHPPEGAEYDGVKYQNYWTFNLDDEFDVLWVWRLPELYNHKITARLKILDLHDVMSPADFPKERLENIDKIFVKTNFHRSLLPAIPDDKFVVVGNGIDLSRFQNGTTKEPYRFIYSSSPNRGLDIILDMWSKIKAALPEATLHVFYGWKTFYKLEKNNPERMMWMKKMKAKMTQPGVVDHGRVGQKELAQEMLKSSYWLYPTYFPEIDCITAKEMQAAGVIPITSGYAALEESQVSGVKLPGDVYDPEWQQKFVDTVISLPKSPTPDLSRFEWDIITNKWNEICSNINPVLPS